ncbi:curli production assembly protein CsgG [bacterium]|nr:curli production assembly protein CsgG [bacterium]
MRILLIFGAVFLIVLQLGCAKVNAPQTQTATTGEIQTSAVLEQESSGRFLKRKVAIARFSNETKYGKGIFSGDDMLGQQASDILTTKLTQTNKFILFESDFASISTDVEFQNLTIPADYLIVGSVSEFGRQVTGDTGVFSRTKKQTAFAKIFVRLVKVSTGQVVYGDEGAGEAFIETGTTFGAGSSAGYDSSLNDKAIEAAISQLVNNIVNNLLHDPWRSYVLDIDGDTIIMSGGASQGISIGDRFTVFKRGKTVTNPQTGLKIELEGTPVAKLEVVSMTGNNPMDEISICALASGAISGDVVDFYIQEPSTKVGLGVQ